jgi:D-sedoheptulose 7-phosphate isomerase
MGVIIPRVNSAVKDSFIVGFFFAIMILIELYSVNNFQERNMDKYLDLITDYLGELKNTIDLLDKNQISKALERLCKALEDESNIFIFGNGGSAATASHFQNDFNKGISEYTEKKFRFLCLNDNIASVLAIANDISFDEIFRFQLEGRLKPGDVVIAISGSGNSKNVLRAAEYTKSLGNTLITLTGFDGGKLRKLADIDLHADVKSMQITEDIHMILDHLMMAVLYKTLAGKDHLRT